MDSAAITGTGETPADAAPDAPVGIENPGAPVDELLQRLHGGELKPDQLTLEDRQRCISQLTTEGFSNAEIGHLLRLSERTVRRDRAALRRDEALKPGASLGDELMGEFHRLTLAGVQRLTHLVQDRQAPAYVRLWAEEAIIRIYQRFLDTTHKLNYIRDGAGRLQHQLDLDPEEHEHRAFARFKLLNPGAINMPSIELSTALEMYKASRKQRW